MTYTSTKSSPTKEMSVDFNTHNLKSLHYLILQFVVLTYSYVLNIK
jgi:hypothetical protein